LLGTNKPIDLKEGTYLFAIGFGLDAKRKYINRPCLLHVGKIETEMFWDKIWHGWFKRISPSSFSNTGLESKFLPEDELWSGTPME